MDILAHTLWAGASAKGANAVAEKKNKNFHVHVGWTAFFGVFPDLLAFSLPFLFRIYFLFAGSVSFSTFWGVRTVEGSIPQNGFNIAHTLYQYSHSLVIWALVFAVVWIFFKRPRYELLGWMLHILIDIPSHVLAFYPTPFLFPISDYKFPYGIQWSNGWFMIINYSALLLIWGNIAFKKLLNKKML